MRSISLTIFTAVVALGLACACKKDKDKMQEDPAEPDPTQPVDKPTTPEPEPSKPEMVNKMKHCPSAVEGAQTKVEKTADAVVVTVTATDEAAVTAIRERAMHLSGLGEADTSEVKHTGQGTGGGVLGKCPVVLKDVEPATEEVEGGAKITLKPKDAAGLDALFDLASKRGATMPAQ